MSDCSSSDVATWVLTAVTIVSLCWAITNELLSVRRGDRNKQIVCMGDCVREVFKPKVEPPVVINEESSLPPPAPSWWKN